MNLQLNLLSKSTMNTKLQPITALLAFSVLGGVLVANFFPPATSPSSPNLPAQQDQCECTASIDGEQENGGNVESNLTPAPPSYSYAGKVTLVNEAELQGACDLGSGSLCQAGKTCIWDIHFVVTVDAGNVPPDPVPYEFKMGGVTTPLSPTNGGFPYTETSVSQRITAGCDGSQSASLRVKDSSGNTLATASFTGRCADCPGAN
jgi:hypothetical protein